MDAVINIDRSARMGSEEVFQPARPLHVIGLRETVGLLRRRKVFILLFVLATMLALVFTLSSMRNSYTATAALVLERRDTPVPEAVSELPGDQRDRSAIETEMDIITSRNFAGRVVDAMNLIEHPWYNTYLPDPDADEPGPLGRLVRGVKGAFGLDTGSTPQKLPPIAVQRDRAITVFLSTLSVTRSGESLAVSVRVRSPDPELSATLANTVANVYVEWSRDVRKKAMTDAVNFLRERAAQVAARIAENERAITDFSRINDLAADARDDVLRQRVDGINTQLTAARVELAGIRARRDQARRVLSGTEDLDGTTLTSPVLTTLRGEKVRLVRERAQYASNLGANHPQVLKADAELASVAGMITGEIHNVADELAGEEAIVSDRVRLLEGQIAELQAAVRRRSLAEIKLRELERDLLADQKLHDVVVARLGGLDPYAEVAKPSARVVSVAAVPTEPSFPQRSRIFAGGLVGSVVLAAVLAVMVEAIDTRIRSGQRVFQVVQLPNLAGIPKRSRHRLRRQKPFVELLGRPHSVYTEALRSLYVACRARLPATKPAVLFASPLPQDGAAAVALGFADAAAHDGLRTIVIDLDPPPSAPAGPTLEDVVAGTYRLADAIRPVADVPGLDLLIAFGGRKNGRADTLVRSEGVRAVIEGLRSSYDMIVLHSAPVLILEDANWLSPFVDGVVLVVRFGRTTEQELASAVSRLQINRAPLIGTALTDVDPTGQPGQEALGAANYRRQARAYLSN